MVQILSSCSIDLSGNTCFKILKLLILAIALSTYTRTEAIRHYFKASLFHPLHLADPFHLERQGYLMLLQLEDHPQDQTPDWPWHI